MILHDFTVYTAIPPQYSDTSKRFPVAYLPGTTDVRSIMNILSTRFSDTFPPCILAGIDGKDWNTTFSPWQAPKLGKNLGPFSGSGQHFLDILETHIIPAVDASYRTLPEPENRTLAGYSLAGLLTLYALFNSTCFQRFACISGSLWYPQWTGYVKSHTPVSRTPKIYVSLGEKEQESRNPVMAIVETCTRETVSALAAYNPFFEHNPGGHFNDMEERIVKGIQYCATR